MGGRCFIGCLIIINIFSWKEVDLCHALVDALRRNYVEFVELLIDYGTSITKLTLYNLEQLYAAADVCII